MCIERLDGRFPDSTRVTILQGMLLEAKGMPKEALILYQGSLEDEPSNVLLHKRRIAAMRAIPGGLVDAFRAIAEYLDIFPADEEAWLELAHMYLEQNRYEQAVFALEELLLLSPQNSFYVLQCAEALYTAGEIAKAYKMYLRILELANGDVRTQPNTAGELAAGPWIRTLWGLKLVRPHGAA